MLKVRGRNLTHRKLIINSKGCNPRIFYEIYVYISISRITRSGCVDFVWGFQFPRKPRLRDYLEIPQVATNRFLGMPLSVGGPLGKLAVRSLPMGFLCDFFAKAPARRLYSRFPGISKGVVNYGKRGRNNRHRWAVSVGRVHVRRRFGSFRPRAPYILRSYPVALADESRYGRLVRGNI